jgi:hypothetical protein
VDGSLAKFEVAAAARQIAAALVAVVRTEPLAVAELALEAQHIAVGAGTQSEDTDVEDSEFEPGTSIGRIEVAAVADFVHQAQRESILC